MAERFKSCFSPGVIEIVESKSQNEARVFRHDELKDSVQLSRVPDHFICKYFNSLICFCFLSRIIVNSLFSYGGISRSPQIISVIY